MRVLFVHQNFPGQYRHLAPAMAGRGDTVVALGENPGKPLPKVRHIRYKPAARAKPATHHYLRRLEAATYRGQQVVRAALQMQRQGFKPDLVCCHPGWGEGLFLRDVFPNAKLLYYYEYYYGATDGDVGFDPPGRPISLDEACRTRTLNANHLVCLQASDWGHTATEWQASRFPDWARQRISVVHEGIDTQAIHPLLDPRIALPDGRVLRRGDEVVTFIGRGLEPYRGFPSFMRALPEILSARQAAQVLIVGGDNPHYGSSPKEGGTWRTLLLQELGARLDVSRVHFVGSVSHAELQHILGISAAHVYLTYPFVLSWSMLEAMANECLIIGSATPPVQEVIEDGRNGVLVDFFSPADIARAVVRALAEPEAHRVLRRVARQTVLERYDLRRTCLPALMALADAVAAGQVPARRW